MAEWEQGKTWRELVDIHVGHLLAGEADHHGVRSRPIKTLLDQAERDLAQARADAAKYRAALERYANDEHLIPVGGGHSKDCRTCQTRATLEAQ